MPSFASLVLESAFVPACLQRQEFVEHSTDAMMPLLGSQALHAGARFLGRTSLQQDIISSTCFCPLSALLCCCLSHRLSPALLRAAWPAHEHVFLLKCCCPRHAQERGCLPEAARGSCVEAVQAIGASARVAPSAVGQAAPLPNTRLASHRKHYHLQARRPCRAAGSTDLGCSPGTPSQAIIWMQPAQGGTLPLLAPAYVIATCPGLAFAGGVPPGSTKPHR